ncbi:NRDE family protein [Tenacibaculum agarivorans]|uniref:NRDE family protein n=1 Tax=Tenacibaculum agarivorans TaxID=1908389 RepID=UPI00094B8D1E|nr:NRDE family protein [Tenacibaculum agarivorans]
MCTVTYLPLGNNDFILTSNRDENPKRKTIAPTSYIEDGVTLTYPKDVLAGGTWIGVSEKDRLICLLNGGFENHIRKESYRASRGVIVKELLKVEDVVVAIQELNLADIEPFTIVLVDWSKELQAYELVWTGEEKSFKKLANEPHIWSSSTLYTEEMKVLRREWFAAWLEKNKLYTQERILKFHQDENKGNVEISPKMKRKRVETISTTVVQKMNTDVSVSYVDYVEMLQD